MLSFLFQKFKIYSSLTIVAIILFISTVAQLYGEQAGGCVNNVNLMLDQNGVLEHILYMNSSSECYSVLISSVPITSLMQIGLKNTKFSLTQLFEIFDYDGTEYEAEGYNHIFKVNTRYQYRLIYQFKHERGLILNYIGAENSGFWILLQGKQ